MSTGNDSGEIANRSTPSRLCGIVVALPEELSTLTGQKPAQGECMSIADNILLIHSGAGAKNAEHAALQLIDKGANCLISWGCAAALAPQLSPGDLVIPELILSDKTVSEQRFYPDASWSRHIQALFNGRQTPVTAHLVESRQLVAGSVDKQRIHRETGAVALDMESAAVAKVANQAGLACLVIRAIADPASMDLPRAVVQALNDQGQVELPKLLRYLLSHPWEIPALIKLGLHFNAAQKTLKALAKQLDNIINF